MNFVSYGKSLKGCDKVIMNIWIETDKQGVDEVVSTLDTLYKMGLIETWHFDVKEKIKKTNGVIGC